MAWIWRLEASDGRVITDSGFANTSHANQSDAETWLGETWCELADAGVSQVTLFEDDGLIYGPMPLSEA
jgi:hypothetical protein